MEDNMEIVKLMLLVLILGAVLYMIFQNKKPKKVEEKPILKENIEITKENVKEAAKVLEEKEKERKKQEKVKKAFNNLMGYDYNVALKKNNEEE